MLINWDYLNIFKEPPLMLMAVARHAFTRWANRSDAELLVNTCLIGEFAASAPALAEYLAKQTHPVDLLVSPPLKTLAERMHGVRHVYVARSVFARANEHAPDTAPVGPYRTVRILRISHHAYQVLHAVETARLETSFMHLVRYGLQLAWGIVVGATPRSWREINFFMLGSVPKHLGVEHIFDFTPEDRGLVRALPALNEPGPAVFLHTSATWEGNRWPPERWVELIKRLHHSGIRCIFVGAAREQADYEHIARQLNFPTHSLIGTLDLKQLVLALQTPGIFIGVDSGPRNVAHLADMRSITLLGPGPHMYTPEDARDIVLDHSGGRGLYQRFFNKTKNRFIDRISVDEVYEAYTKLSH